MRLGTERWVDPAARRSAKAPLLLLRVSPVRGYDKPFRRVCACLEDPCGLQVLGGDGPAGLLGVTAPWAATKPPSSTVRLRPEMRADEAVKTIYRAQLAAMLRNERGTREAIDSEFLHEFRVAIRRTRAGLARLKGILPLQRTERFKRDFRWLGTITGPKRDLDVHLIELANHQAAIPAEARPHLEPLAVYLEARAEEAQQALARALGCARYRRIVHDWGAFLEQPGPRRSSLPDACRPIGAVASGHIWRLHRRVLKRGEAIDDQTPAERVHDLRLDCKKLRYLMEFFRSLYDPDAMKQQIRALKRLQENLGDFNDMEVQQGALRTAGRGMAGQGLATPETHMAMGRVIEALARRQVEERERVTERFREFGAPANRARAEKLFRTPNGERK